MSNVNIKDVMEGDILGQDLYKGESLVFKRGNRLSANIISKLKQWGFTSIKIDNGRGDDSIIEQDNEMNSTVVVPDVSELKEIFFRNLANIGHEYRYGHALHDVNDYKWLEGLFIKFMSNDKVYQLMEKLKGLDNYTYEHSFDVFIFGSLFAKRIELKDIESFSLGCLLHDVGKMDISKVILNKKSKLTQSEYDEIKNHTVYGYYKLKQYGFSENIAALAKYHHERMDGSGYPEGIQGDVFTKEFKVISIADVYSALTLNRPYRDALGSTTAEKILLNECRDTENYYFYHFFKMLNIYPLKTIVELNNGITAKVISANDKVPTFPVLKNVDKPNQIKMPLNRTISIKKIIRF